MASQMPATLVTHGWSSSVLGLQVRISRVCMFAQLCDRGNEYVLPAEDHAGCCPGCAQLAVHAAASGAFTCTSDHILPLTNSPLHLSQAMAASMGCPRSWTTGPRKPVQQQIGTSAVKGNCNLKLPVRPLDTSQLTAGTASHHIPQHSCWQRRTYALCTLLCTPGYGEPFSTLHICAGDMHQVSTSCSACRPSTDPTNQEGHASDPRGCTCL
jgi:hypothetical protein